MRGSRVWRKVLGVQQVTIDGFGWEGDGEDEVLVIDLHPTRAANGRCSRCERRCRGYDQGGGVRRWRALDLATTLCFLEADAPRVRCKRHGVVVAAVPWARHDSWFTRPFEDQCAWLAVNTSATAVAALMRSTWRAVGGICRRVADEARAQRDLLAGLRRIGVDEISVRKGQSYITVVVDHDSGRLVWAHPGRDGATVRKFLDGLGEERCAQIELVSCDMATWITGPIAERCPGAQVCLDPFHVVKLATDALDEIRRAIWNQARKDNNKQLAKDLKGARFALWKNADKLTDRQQHKLAWIQRFNAPLYRAYLLAQQLRQIYRVPAEQATRLLDAWLKWAWRCRLQPFVELAKTIREQRPGIQAAIENKLSNARTEQINTQIRLITRRGFGYHSPQAVIALAMLSLSDLCPPLPTR